MKPAGQFVEQRAQVPVRDNRFRNRQQRSVLLDRRDRLCAAWEFTHDGTTSINPVRRQSEQTKRRRVFRAGSIIRPPDGILLDTDCPENLWRYTLQATLLQITINDLPQL